MGLGGGLGGGEMHAGPMYQLKGKPYICSIYGLYKQRLHGAIRPEQPENREAVELEKKTKQKQSKGKEIKCCQSLRLSR